jgi:hypothetical protein
MVYIIKYKISFFKKKTKASDSKGNVNIDAVLTHGILQVSNLYELNFHIIRRLF